MSNGTTRLNLQADQIEMVLAQHKLPAQVAGDLAEARRLYDQSLAIERELGNKEGVAISLSAIALLDEQEGNIARALDLIPTAEQLFTQLGKPYACAGADSAREVGSEGGGG